MIKIDGDVVLEGADAVILGHRLQEGPLDLSPGEIFRVDDPVGGVAAFPTQIKHAVLFA